MEKSGEKLYRAAATLAVITIFYNVIEGVVSVWFRANDVQKIHVTGTT